MRPFIFTETNNPGFWCIAKRQKKTKRIKIRPIIKERIIKSRIITIKIISIFERFGFLLVLYTNQCMGVSAMKYVMSKIKLTKNSFLSFYNFFLNLFHPILAPVSVYSHTSVLCNVRRGPKKYTISKVHKFENFYFVL